MSYTTKTQDDITNDILLGILENVTSINDANVGSVLRNYVESVALEIKNIYDALDDIYAGTRIDTATSTDLEQLGKLVGITRKTGTKSQGYVTFIRNTVASADFIISANSVVGTQPISGNDQLRFLTLANSTFSAEIEDEDDHGYYTGVMDYRMTERFLGDTSNITISGLISDTTSSVTSFVVQSDWSGYIIDTDTITMIDDCDALTNWTSGVGATAIATSPIYIEATSSIALGKTISTSDGVYYEKSFSSTLSGSGKDFVPFVRLNSTSFDRLSKIDFYLSDNATITQAYKYTVNVSSISEDDFDEDWYHTALTYASDAVKYGNPSISNLNYIRIVLTTNTAAQTLESGDVLVDFLNFSETDYYLGDIIQFDQYGAAIPDHETDFLVTYKPLSADILCEANVVGTEYNVNREKITYKITNVSAITSVSNYEIMTGGSDLEVDADLKERILYASELVGKGTAESIRQAVLAVNGVAACTIDDTPKISMTNEPHVFDALVDKYKLDFEVLYLDNITSPTNITITGTVGSSAGHTFLYSTDFIRVTDSYNVPTSQVHWQATGTKPDDASTFYAAYTSDWLGHVNIFVTGVENPLPSSVLTLVETAVDDTRAAGVETEITTPDEVDVSVTAGVEASTGYTLAGITDACETAIYDFLNALSAGEDVYLASLFEVVMGVTGVENVELALPAADTTIASDEIARPNVITIYPFGT